MNFKKVKYLSKLTLKPVELGKSICQFLQIKNIQTNTVFTNKMDVKMVRAFFKVWHEHEIMLEKPLTASREKQHVNIDEIPPTEG